MPLVEAPAVDHGQPGAVHFIEHVPQGSGGALKHAPRMLGLLNAEGGQIDVGPARKAVVWVPGGFPVADKNESVHAIFKKLGSEKPWFDGVWAPSF